MTDKLISPLRNPYFAIIKISIITIFLLSLSVIIADAAVTLVYFRANPEEDNININWKTATEYDNAGFFVVRSLTENGDFERLPIGQPEFIFAEGNGPIEIW